MFPVRHCVGVQKRRRKLSLPPFSRATFARDESLKRRMDGKEGKSFRPPFPLSLHGWMPGSFNFNPLNNGNMEMKLQIFSSSIVGSWECEKLLRNARSEIEIKMRCCRYKQERNFFPSRDDKRRRIWTKSLSWKLNEKCERFVDEFHGKLCKTEQMESACGFGFSGSSKSI